MSYADHLYGTDEGQCKILCYIVKLVPDSLEELALSI